MSEIPRNAVVVWVSHYWGGTPARPDDQGNTKAKAIYEGLAVREKGFACDPWRSRDEGVIAVVLFCVLHPCDAFGLFCVGDILPTGTGGKWG